MLQYFVGILAKAQAASWEADGMVVRLPITWNQIT